MPESTKQTGIRPIQVVDATGKKYAPTYRKRARGLVKKGRASFIAADTICLTAPPHPRKERFMENKLTAEEIFAELKLIREDKNHVTMALDKLEKAPTECGDNEACVEKIRSIASVVESRENTNQALIHLYEEMLKQIDETESNAE